MKKLQVITASPGLSGAGIIFDYLLSREDFTSPFKNFPDNDQQSEFRFVSDPGGLNSLYSGFYENFSINNSSYVFNEFKIYLNKLKKLNIIKNGKKKYLYDKNFFKETDKFQKKIIKVKYFGLPQYHRLGLNIKDRALWKIMNKFKTSQEVKFLEMVVPVKRDVFIKESKKFVNKILKTLSKKNNKHFILDQAANFWKPEESTNFFSNKKIILISRDPRSIFSSMKRRKSLAYPGHDVNTFVAWYKNMIKFSQKNIDKKNILKIKYEDFIINHKKEEKKLLKFLGLRPKKHKYFNLQNSTKNIFKANKYLTKKELKIIEVKLKNYLQWPKKIYI